MKLSKKIFWISLLISIITIIISVYIEFFSEKNQQLTFISNIVQNVFAGTSVLTITSLYEYWSIKKKTFDEIIEEVNIMKDRFSKIQYYEDKDFESLENYLNYYKEKYDIKHIEKIYNMSKEKYIKEQNESFERIINQYIDIAEINFNSFWNKYKKIDFIFDHKHNKEKIYNDFFKYIYYDKIDKIREKSFHFKEYKNSKNGNYIINKQFLSELQQEIFIFKEWPINENIEINNDEFDIVDEGHNFIDETSYIVGNKVTKHLNNFHEYMVKLTYKK